MKLLILITIISLSITGCGKKDLKPAKITIRKNGAFFVDGKRSNNQKLRQYIKNKMTAQNQDTKVIYIADKETLFTTIESVMLTVSEEGAVRFFFQKKGSVKREECWSNCYPGSGPRPRKVDLEIKDNILYFDGKKMTQTQIAALFERNILKKDIDMILISCSGTTTFQTFYAFIEHFNKLDLVHFELQLLDKMQ